MNLKKSKKNLIDKTDRYDAISVSLEEANPQKKIENIIFRFPISGFIFFFNFVTSLGNLRNHF